MKILICEITQEVTNQWTISAAISLNQFMPNITLQIILQIVFGINSGARHEELKQLLNRFLKDVTTP